MSKIKFINKSRKSKCWVCNGTGLKDGKFSSLKVCPACKGSGKWTEDNYILVATNNKGQKIAFGVDGIK